MMIKKWFPVLVYCICICLSAFEGKGQEDVEKLLIGYEQQKWEGLRKGVAVMSASQMGADFYSIGYMPDGGVYIMDRSKMAREQQQAPAKMQGTADFSLSNFKVIHAHEAVKVVTYQADGPLNLYVSSTWSLRDGTWKTVFYQATRYK